MAASRKVLSTAKKAGMSSRPAASVSKQPARKQAATNKSTSSRTSTKNKATANNNAANTEKFIKSTSLNLATQQTSQNTKTDQSQTWFSRRKNAKELYNAQEHTIIPSAWALLKQSTIHLYRHKKLFLGILAIYGILYILFVKGVSDSFQLGNLQQNLDATFNGKLDKFSSGVALYGLLLGTSGGSSTSQISGLYQMALVVIVSLALIWALRKTYAGNINLKVKDSFYKSAFPLVPFILVLVVVLLQTLPALTGISLFSVVQANGIAIGSVQYAIVLFLLLLSFLWSFYMLSSSMFALYIVTLPDAMPLESLRAAKKLVAFRRWKILRKVVFLPVILLLASAIVLIPLIIFIAPAAEVIFILFTIAVLAVVHSYFYSLYRSLL